MLRVFISWSGQASQSVALAMRDWLPRVIQSVQPFVSSEQEKGLRWGQELAKELEGCDYGILCVTPGNVGAPWLNFEAGALSKKVDVRRVTPFLIGMATAAELKGPLAQFQACVFTEEDVLRLVRSVNLACEEQGLDNERLDESFRMRWPSLKERLEAIVENGTHLSSDSPSIPARSVEDMVAEILQVVRGQALLLINRPEVPSRDAIQRAIARLTPPTVSTSFIGQSERHRVLGQVRPPHGRLQLRRNWKRRSTQKRAEDGLKVRPQPTRRLEMVEKVFTGLPY